VLLGEEEGTLRQMEEWVDSGGRLVIGFTDGWPSPKFLQTFALEGVRFINADNGEVLYEFKQDSESDGRIPTALRKLIEARKQREDTDQKRSLREDFDEIIAYTPAECARYPIAECTGRFRPMCETIESLALRTGEPIALDTGDSSPASVLKIQGGEQARTLIAEYKWGRGSVLLVSDVSLFDNLSLRAGDNSVLLVNVLSDGRAPVLFDEFFHGLSIRGNPIWIFAQPGYRIIILMLLGTVALFIWHELPSFGVVPPPETTPRRTLDAYLDSVSRLLLRTRSQRRQLLAESKDAFLWKTARKLQLAGERNQLDAIRNHLRRVDAAQADEFDVIIAAYERYDRQGCSSKDLLALLQRSHRCLS